VADPVSLDADHFWAGGKYVIAELERVYTGAHALALQRLDAIRGALAKYEPDLTRVKGIGFCVNVGHAGYMARMFSEKLIPSAVLTGETGDADRSRLIEELRAGRLTFLFTVDVLNEGLDVPEVNTVLFLRPTESLTIFPRRTRRSSRIWRRCSPGPPRNPGYPRCGRPCPLAAPSSFTRATAAWTSTPRSD